MGKKKAITLSQVIGKLKRILWISTAFWLLLYGVFNLLFPEPPSLPVVGVVNTYFWPPIFFIISLAALALIYLLGFIRFLILSLK